MSGDADGPGGLEEPGPVQIDAQAHDHATQYIAGRDVNFGSTVLPEAAVRPVAQVEAPTGLVNVPFHTHVFVGREAELADVGHKLAGAAPVVVAAVHGLGGIGKSTLAARYAADQAGTRNPAWWITADSPAAIETGLAGLATSLQPELAKVLPLEVLAERATAWLAAHTGWLLVLDNVTDPAHIAPLLGRIRSGRVLVTSRLGEGWYRLGARVVSLGVLSESEAVNLLTRIATADDAARPDAGGDRQTRTDTDGVSDGAVELVRELGCLPLAVEQAAAYIHQNRLTPAIYLDLLRQTPEVMFDQAARGTNDQRTIARIWRMTLDTLTDTPLAGSVLRILAWYAPEAIPRTLLDTLDDDHQIQQALGSLAAYNMITLETDAITVHRLVQAIARTPDPRWRRPQQSSPHPSATADPHRRPPDIIAARQHATRLLNQALPEHRDPAGWPTWRTLLSHIEALADHAAPDTDTTDTDLLVTHTGLFLQDQGAVRRAITYLNRSLTTSQRLHGADHPDTLTSRNNLTNAYQAAGDPRRAIPLHERTLADRQRVLGADHPDTLTSGNNLAYAYQAAGDLGRVMPLHEKTLADFERVLGVDHPATLASRNNLAYAYQAAGDLERAMPLHEQTLADTERVLGVDHPTTLASRNNLARAYQAAGDLERAIQLHEQTLADTERVLGADHPMAGRVRDNLEAASAPRED